MGVRVPAIVLAVAAAVGAALFLTMGQGSSESANMLAVLGYLLVFFGGAGLVAIAITTRVLPVGEKFDQPWNRD